MSLVARMCSLTFTLHYLIFVLFLLVRRQYDCENIHVSVCEFVCIVLFPGVCGSRGQRVPCQRLHECAGLESGDYFRDPHCIGKHQRDPVTLAEVPVEDILGDEGGGGRAAIAARGGICPGLGVRSCT
jgi:hypothetical protein